jgi:hypothetical protein
MDCQGDWVISIAIQGTRSSYLCDYVSDDMLQHICKADCLFLAENRYDAGKWN